MSPFVCAGSGARWRYVNNTCPGLSRLISTGCGSFTFTIMSAVANTSSASGRILAPTRVYMSSNNPMPSPAFVCTNTSCPRAVSSRTALGVMPTRYSWFLISLGTPTRIWASRSCSVLPAILGFEDRHKSKRRYFRIPRQDQDLRVDGVVRCGNRIARDPVHQGREQRRYNKDDENDKGASHQRHSGPPALVQPGQYSANSFDDAPEIRF